MNKETEFKQELKKLLEKYKASIGFSCDDSSDTYGIIDAKIAVVFDDNKEITLSKSFWLDESDL